MAAMYKFMICTYAIIAMAISSPLSSHKDVPVKPAREFSRADLIAAGERGGPLTPTAGKFAPDDNRSFGFAMADWNAHRYDIAMEKFKAHIKDYPGSPWAAEADLHIGCFNFYRGRYELAEESFLRILSKHKEGQISRKALIRLGILYANSSRLEEASSCFERCVALKPTWQQATLCQGWRMKLQRLKMNNKHPSDCGPLALKKIFDLKGIPCPEEFTEKESSSFLDIARIAEEQGLKTIGAKLTYEDLVALKEPVVVQINPPHFLVVERADSRNVFVIDPHGGKRVLPHDRFVDIWDGYTLLFNPGKEQGGTHLSETEMKGIQGGCCGEPPIADDLGDTVDDLPVGGSQGNGTGGCGSPSVSINPRSLNIVINDTPIGYQPARGPAVAFKLTYNSLNPQDGTGGGGGLNYYPFGNKWSSNIDSHYLLNPGGNITIVMPDGKRDVYVRNASPNDHTFTPPLGVYHTLVENLDGSYTLTLKTVKDKYHYSPTHQIISSVEDRWGNKLTLNRDANGRLTGVVDAAGRTTSVVSDGNGRITSITDPIGRTASFGYDGGGNLTSVTDMGGYAYSYTYLWNDEYGFVLSTLMRPTGLWTFVHAFPDHVIEDPPVNHTWETYKITMIDPKGYREIYYWKGGIYWGVGMSGPTEIIDRNGNITRYFFGDPESPYIHIVTKGNDVPYPDYEFYQMGYDYMDYHYDSDGNRTEIIKVADKDCTGGHEWGSSLPCETRTTATYTYQNGNVTSWTDAGGHPTVYEYDADDNLTSITDPMQKTTGFTYDEYGNLTSVIPPEPFEDDTTDYTYTPHGKVETITNARGYTTVFHYDTLDRLEYIDYPDSTSTSFDYDEIDRLTSTTLATGFTLDYDYDNLNRVAHIYYPDETYEEYQYDCCGLNMKRDRSGEITYYDRDSLSRLVSVTDPEGNYTEYTYDPLGNIIKIQAAIDGPLRTVAEYAYATPADDPYDQENHLNNLAAIVFPIKKTRQFDYYWTGELETMTLESGEIVAYAYDEGGRLEDVSYAESEETGYEYDDDDRVASVTHVASGLSWTTGYMYDPLGRTTSVEGPDTNDTIMYTYDPVGNRATMSVNDITTSYTYDPMNRLSSVASPYASATYAYVDGQLDAISYNNGDTVEYGYDAYDRLSSMVNKNSSQDVLASYTYGYNLPNLITGVMDKAGFTDSYQYDNIYRLTREKRQYPSGVIQQMNRFGYDEIGNRKRYSEDGVVTETAFTLDNQIDQRSIGVLTDVIGKAESGDWQVKVDGNDAVVESDGTFVYEGLDLTPGQHTVTASGINPFTQHTATDTITITKLPETDEYYIYNGRGDMVYRSDSAWIVTKADLAGMAKADSSGMTSYEWDLLDRLREIHFPDLTTHEYYYDGLGRRMKNVENGVERRFVYDGWNVLGERREGSDDFV